jgi:hypothetical protein
MAHQSAGQAPRQTKKWPRCGSDGAGQLGRKWRIAALFPEGRPHKPRRGECRGESNCSAANEVDEIMRPCQGRAGNQKKIQHQHRKPEKTDRPKRPHEEDCIGGMEARKRDQSLHFTEINHA